jgi:uncharacterized protein YwqG
MIWSIFGPRKPKPPPRDIEALLRGLERPAAQLVRTDRATSSQIGGVPRTASAFDWPVKDGVPLGFLAQIDLAELAAVQRIDWLPESGDLLFFYDMKEQPWGFDPQYRGAWAVVYLPAAGARTQRAEPARLPEESSLSWGNIELRRVNTFPSDSLKKLELSIEEEEKLAQYREALFGKGPQHQVGGAADPIQNEMELECQLAANGLYCGDSTGYKDPRAKALEAGAADWRLLLQFDTDDAAGVMWGDCGRLYFWIREQDARAKRFDRAWLILQCF